MNLACAPFVVSFSLCSLTSRLSELIRVGDGGRENAEVIRAGDGGTENAEVIRGGDGGRESAELIRAGDVGRENAQCFLHFGNDFDVDQRC